MGGAQLTIFYSGKVNMYEDVPADKAHAIMLLLSNGNSSGISGCYDRTSPKPAHVNSTENTSTNIFNSVGSGVRSRSSTPSRPSDPHTITRAEKKQQTQQQLVMRRTQAHGLSFARKASLARFLGKRKDRVDIAKLATLNESSMVKVNYEGSQACKKMKL